MVAKMPLSSSFLITRLAFTSSFSESSLTVMPSEMVICRLMGGGPLSAERRIGRSIFSSGSLTRWSRCGRAPPRCGARRWSVGGGATAGSMRPREVGMHGPRAAGARRGRRDAAGPGRVTIGWPGRSGPR